MAKVIQKNWTIQGRPIEQLVENRINHNCKSAQLSMFETFEKAFAVPLEFDSPVLVSMVSGKKVMHFQGESSFEFAPAEALVLPSHTAMQIDFPEASLEEPTRCIALSLSPELIDQTLALLNNSKPVVSEWQLQAQSSCVLRHKKIQRMVHSLIESFLEEGQHRELLIELQLKQLIVTILQTEAAEKLLKNHSQYSSSHPFSYVAEYIQNNLHENITIEQLSQKACMSQPTFYRTFKNQFGMTPLEYVLLYRIKKAKQILSSTDCSVTEVAYQCGFNSAGYFIRTFKKLTGKTPKAFSSSTQTFYR
jgi:AraC-like DNA-binding protein